MAWIKRNLIFVVCSVVGVALLGVAIFFLVGSISENQEAADKFSGALSDLKGLEEKNPYPSAENITAAKADKERMKAFLGDFKKIFADFPVPPRTDDKGFKTYLQGTIAELQSAASNASVQLPPEYAFSFSGQVSKLNFSPECIQPWMEQLEEIKAICRILYGAKINYLEGLQRVPVCGDDPGGSDYLGASSVTNQNGVTTPYKITFRGFSGELAAVLAGFERSSNCFIIKDVDVAPSKGDSAPGFAPAAANPAYQHYAMAPAPSPSRNAEAEYARRYGPGPGAPGPNPRYAPTPAPAPVAAAARPAVATAPVPILWERQLYVTLSLDVVKLKAGER